MAGHPWGPAVRAAREVANLTQADLADLAGIDQTTISSIEVGRRHPTDDVKVRIARALSEHTGLRVRPSDLFPLEGDE